MLGFCFSRVGGWDTELKRTQSHHCLVPLVTFRTPLPEKCSSLKIEVSIGHALTVCIHTESQNQVSFHPFVLHKISLLNELTLGPLRYHLTDVPPQPNSQPDSVLGLDHPVQ